jgi:integrase-like protein
MGNDFEGGHRGAPPGSWAAPFRKALSLRGRPEARVKWYFVWARRFAASLSDKPLRLATREDAEGFLSTLASSPGIAAWQMEQATDGLTILLGSVFGQEWAGTIRIPAPPPPPDVPLPKGDEPAEHLRYAIRCRRYSVRTEESYVFWVNRFLVFCRDGGVDAGTGAQCARFLLQACRRYAVRRPRGVPAIEAPPEVAGRPEPGGGPASAGCGRTCIPSPGGAALRRRPATHGGAAIAGEGHRSGSPSDLGPGRDSSRARTSARCRNCSGTATSRRR